ANEKDLVEDFIGHLAIQSPWGRVKTNAEFFYQHGKTDVVALDPNGRVIAFEAKLVKWKQALHQAYRNTCFAHRSYVLLPKETAMIAFQAAAAFDQRRVGICYVDQGVVILQDAEEVRPLQPWLSDKAARHVLGGPTYDETG